MVPGVVGGEGEAGGGIVEGLADVEDAVEHVRGGHGGLGGDGLADALAFIAEEEEGLIPQDGTANGGAEGVLFEGGLFDAGRGEVGAGVGVLVADKLVGGAVELVGAGLGDDVDLAAGHAAVLGGVDAGEQAELLDDFNGRAEAGLGDAHVVVEDAVDGELVGDLAGAGDVDAAAEAEGGVLRGLEGSGGQQSQSIELAVGERELDDLLVIDERAVRGGLGLG